MEPGRAEALAEALSSMRPHAALTASARRIHSLSQPRSAEPLLLHDSSARIADDPRRGRPADPHPPEDAPEPDGWYAPILGELLPASDPADS